MYSLWGMTEIRPHSATGQAAYFDLLRLLRDGQMANVIGEPRRKKVNGKAYWYDHFRIGTKTVDRYIGEDSAELRERLQRQSEIARQSRSLERERRRLVRLLRSEGYMPVDLMSGQFLSALAKVGVFRLGGTLIGTQAFRLYEGELGLRISSDRMASTMDMDIASFERLSLVLDDTVETPLETIFNDFSFEPVPGLDPGRVWRWKQTNQQTLVEFLTQSFEDDEGIRDLPALGVKAQALHHLNYLIAEPLQAAVLYRDGALVQVPRPERYAVHKLIVADRRRTGPNAMKARKDREQAAFLIKVLSEEDPDALSDAYQDARGRGAAWRRRLDASLTRMPETAARLSALPG